MIVSFWDQAGCMLTVLRRKGQGVVEWTRSITIPTLRGSLTGTTASTADVDWVLFLVQVVGLEQDLGKRDKHLFSGGCACGGQGCGRGRGGDAGHCGGRGPEETWCCGSRPVWRGWTLSSGFDAVEITRNAFPTPQPALLPLPGI